MLQIVYRRLTLRGSKCCKYCTERTLSEAPSVANSAQEARRAVPSAANSVWEAYRAVPSAANTAQEAYMHRRHIFFKGFGNENGPFADQGAF